MRVGIFLSLALGSLFIRLPFIAASAPVSWDENTFFLVASRSVALELPYTTTFDNKPPLAVLPQTLALAAGLDDPWVLRVVAALLLALATYFLTRVGFGRQPSWWQVPIGLSFIVVFSILPEGFGWMTELNAIVVFSVALFLFWRAWLGLRSSPIALGLLLGTLFLVRTNWAMLSLALLIATWYFWRLSRFFRLTLFGALTPVVLVTAIYTATGNLSALINGAVFLPWRYANQADDLSPWVLPPNVLRLVLFAVTLLIISIILRWYLSQIESLKFDWLVVALASVLLITAWAQSPDYGHHGLQFAPFVALGSARAVGAVLELPGPSLAVAFGALTLCVLSTAAVPLSMHYQLLLDQRGMYKPESLQSFGTQIAQDQKKSFGDVGVSALGSVAALPDIDSASIWALDTHDIYWRLNKIPISPLVAHPSSVVEPGFLATFFEEPTTPAQAVTKMFDLKPDVIVFQSLNYLSGAARQTFEKSLKTKYEKRYHLGAHPGVQVWVRVGFGGELG